MRGHGIQASIKNHTDLEKILAKLKEVKNVRSVEYKRDLNALRGVL